MIFNVILNSNDRIDISSSSFDAMYNFDWSIFPDSKFKMTSSFISTNIDSTIVNKIPLIIADLGQISYTTNSLRVQANTSLIIGSLIPHIVDEYSFLYGDKNLNHEIIMKKPSNNTFFIKIITNEIIPKIWTDNKNNSPAYILTLSFEEI